MSHWITLCFFPIRSIYMACHTWMRGQSHERPSLAVRLYLLVRDSFDSKSNNDRVTWVFVLPQATKPGQVRAAESNLLLLAKIAPSKRLSLIKTSTVGVETVSFSETALSKAVHRALTASGDAWEFDNMKHKMREGGNGRQALGGVPQNKMNLHIEFGVHVFISRRPML